MKIVDLYKMSEEERKKALEEQQLMYNERMQQSDEIRRQANQQFNDLVSKQGEYDTSKHTTTIGALRNAYKNSSNYNKLNDSLNRMYLNSDNSIWNKMQKIMTFGNNNNRRNNNISIRDNTVDNWSTAKNIAQQNNENANMIARTQTAKEIYKEKQKEAIKNTVDYNLMKSKNPNMSEDELIEATKLQMNNNDKKFNETFANMSKEERQKEIYKTQNMLNDKEGLFETDNKKIQNKQFINNLRTKSEAIEAEKEAERVNKVLNEGNFLERATTATGELAEAMGKSAIDMTMSPIITAGSLAEGILPTNNFKGTKFDDIVDYKKIKDYGESVKTANIENDVLKAGKGVSSTIGGMIPSIIANITMPGSNIGMITQALGVGGEDYIENLNENKTNKLQSALSGTLKGLGSYATEKITGGNILGKGSLDDWATRTIANGTSKIENETLKKITQKIASKIYEVGGENFEELLENQIDHLVDTTVNNKGITFKEWLDEQSETVKQTTLTKLFLNLMGVGGDTYNEVQKYSQNAEIKQWINEAQKIIDKENLNIDNYKINNNNINEVRKTLNELPIENTTTNLQQNTIQNQTNLPTQQITQQEKKVAQNENIEQRNMLPIQNYIYEKSDNVKIDNLRQDASKYWDNSDKTKNYVNMLEKIIRDKDIDIRLDTNLTDSKGNIANGSYSNGVITINPNSTRAGEFIAVHELTHAIGTDEMRNIIQKYRESNAEFDRAVKSLLQNYNATELTEEAMSDVAGQLFGNQEFINNLAQTEPSLFKKIYNEIKYLWHQFTGYKNQDQFINDLQYKWEQAYRNNTKLNDTTKYSIAGRKSLDNIRNNKILYNSGINSYNQAQQMASRNTSNEQIRQRTGWFQDKNGDWKYEFSDKDMAIKNIRYEQNKNYKLGNILKHDTLFELYPELKQLTVKIDNTNKISGNYNKNSKTITLSKQLLNNSKRLEGTLIHEIQHAIQDIEGFEKGTTSKLSKERYYNNLGEIEADNTRKRFIDEKYNNKDITNEAPESSKTNPKHRGYDNYMNNRDILDKVKDSMFKYFKGLGDSNEILQENNQENIQQDIRLVDDGRNGRYLKESENNSGSFNLSKPKEGYTRLYRGLENEYNANYDKSKLDNSNGYESWTDSYELAKAYGDNVYYIDVPTSEVKNSIIDEDSQSETYGDRNLLYKNDKPVGIKGKSGNEYMLYTDHDNYGNIKYNKIDNNNSTQDNQGRTLSKEQQEYFKDSKVRDDNGNLLEVYHGTKTKGINIFNYDPNRQTGTDYGKAYYFTTDYIKAQGYQYDIEKDPSYIEYSKQDEAWKERVFSANNEEERSRLITEWSNWHKENNVMKLLDNEDFTPERLPDGETKKVYLNIKNPYIVNAKGQYYYKVYDNYFKQARENGNDGIIVKNVIDNPLGEPRPIDVYIAFNANQIKNVDNTNPTTDPDIRYSLPTKEWQQHLEKNYKSKGTRTNLKDIKLPTQETSKEASINLPTKAEKIDWNTIERPEGKIRKHYRSVIESSHTTKEAKAIAKEMMGTDTYVPDSNNKQLERANERIESSTPDSELDSLMSRAKTGGKIDATDIAVGERLIQYYSMIGNKTKLQDAIQATAMAGTTAGQTVQAMSLLNHQTPEGQAIWLQRSVEKMNNDLKKNRGEKAQQFDLTPEMVDKVVKSKNNEELNNNLNEVYKELGQQVSKTTLQKVDSWRYFSMLANPRTHIRNIIGNTAMGKTQGIKNKIAGSIEGVVSKINPDMERTHTILPSSKEIKEFAKNDIKNVADRLGLNENKYNPKTRLESSMRTFKSDAIENTIGKLFDANSKLLEAEDAFGLKSAYRKALSEYMTANKLKPDNITDKQLAKARNYAVEQAQEATFHQASSLATLINQLGNKNKFAKYALDATLPFKKTPINVAKSGIEYSPVGLAKSIIYDSVQLRKGNITVNKYIDNISKGLTGTGIALVGYALANAGILKASGSDDKEGEKFDEEMGNQTYSIKIGDNTYSLDWLAPTGIPLFIGAETFEIMQTENEEKESSSDEDSKYNRAIKTATNLLDASANAMNPMTEMSMLSGLTSALKSYEQGSSQMLASLLTNSAKSYVNQFVPTALGQVAKTTDKYERSTTSTKSGILPRAIDTTKNQIMNKVPGLRQMLPTKTDIWGNDIKQSDNVMQRAFENTIAPYTRKEISSDKVNKELSALYKNIGESSILPSTIEKTFTINSEKYRMTNEEYSKYKENYGKTSYKLLNELINSRDYKNMTNVQRQKAIESVYSYAKESNKIDYAKSNNLEVEKSTVYTTMEELKKNGGSQSQYLNYIGKTVDIEKDREKNQILSNSNYTNKTKTIIYTNTTGKDDNLYNITLKNSNIDIDEYLDYKIKESKEEFSADKDSNGNSISGTSKKKYYNYINSNITDIGSRLIILGSKYKLSNSERHQLSNYINKISSNNEEAIQTFEYLSKNYVVKGGKVYYK